MWHKRIKQDILDLRETQSRLQGELERLQKAWKDELVDLLDLREQVANHLRRLAGRATSSQEPRTQPGEGSSQLELDEVSQRVLERRRHGLRRLQG